MVSDFRCIFLEIKTDLRLFLTNDSYGLFERDDVGSFGGLAPSLVTFLDRNMFVFGDPFRIFRED